MIARSFAVVALAFATAACSSMPKLPSLPGMPAAPQPVAASAPTVTAAPAVAAAAKPEIELGPREHVALATELLGAGKEADAKTHLQAALQKAPKDATALSLMKQIDTDPVTLLGTASSDYVVQAGDSMSVLAQRFAGDPLMFYALSRYNGLAAPNMLSVGKTLKMPLANRPAAVVAAPPPLATPTVVASINPAKANSVRLEALQHLNRGDVTKAVALLKEAQSLDANDAAIKRDLDRALRIQAALASN